MTSQEAREHAEAAYESDRPHLSKAYYEGLVQARMEHLMRCKPGTRKGGKGK